MNRLTAFLLFGLLFVYLSLLIVWATEVETADGFLGGLDWGAFIFNWHPLLMSLSLGLFFFQAIISNFKKSAFRYFRLDHETKKSLHAFLHTLSVISMTVGLVSVFKFHKNNTIPDLYSLHRYFNQDFEQIN